MRAPVDRAAKMMAECRDSLAWSLLDYDRLRDTNVQWNIPPIAWDALEQADAVLVGGGNLFVDENGGFIAGPMTVFAFAISLGEFGATSFIVRPNTTTIPIAIFRLLGRPGTFGEAIAMAVVLMTVTALAALAIESVRGTRSGGV